MILTLRCCQVNDTLHGTAIRSVTGMTRLEHEASDTEMHVKHLGHGTQAQELTDASGFMGAIHATVQTQ